MVFTKIIQRCRGLGLMLIPLTIVFFEEQTERLNMASEIPRDLLNSF